MVWLNDMLINSAKKSGAIEFFSAVADIYMMIDLIRSPR
jgi:hypothetical protein